MNSGSPHVLVDANVLFSKTLRDWILMCHLESDTPMYYLHWTEDILAETVANLRRRYPLCSDSLTTGVRDKIVESIPRGRIEGFTIDPDRAYHDLKDAHVHAAAVHGNVDMLLTGNTKDFVADSDELPYEVLTPDEFLILVDDSAPQLVRQVTRKQVAYYLDRRDSFSLPAALERAGAPTFAARVRLHLCNDG